MKLSKLSSPSILPYLIVIQLYIFYLKITISQSTCEDNNYPCRGDDDSWWYSTEDINPIEGQIYGNLTLRDSMYVEFDIVSHESIANQWENIFRIGYPSITDTRCTGAGSRYPGLWVGPHDDLFHFAVSDMDNCWAGNEWQQDPPNGFGEYELVKDRKYSVMINYNDSRLLIEIKDNTLNTPWETYIDTTRDGTDPLYFNTNVNIFIGSDFYFRRQFPAVADVTLSNMVIVSYWDANSFTLPPTPSPTASIDIF